MLSTVPLLVLWGMQHHVSVMYWCRSGAARLSCVLGFMVLLAIACLHVVFHDVCTFASVLLSDCSAVLLLVL